MHSEQAFSGIRAILLDKDGTLFDFRRTWLPLLFAGAREVAGNDEGLALELVRAGGYDPDTDRFRADGPIAAGNALDMAESWHAVLMRHYGADAARREAGGPPVPGKAELVKEIDRVSRERGVDTSVPVTALRQLFERLTRAGIALGLATSDSTAAAYAALEREHISPFFTYVTGYDGPGGRKPAASVARAFFEPLHIPPSRVMIVGDTWHDLGMARDCGCIAVAVLTGAIGCDDLEPYADVVLESIAGLPELIGL
ncbi:MAG: HAD family hydrolase [Spirochaetota bacterium]